MAKEIDPAQSLLSSLPDAVMVCDDSGVIVGVNRHLLSLTGYKSSELLGNTVEVLFSEGLSLPEASRDGDGVTSPGTPPEEIEARVVTSHGDRIDVRAAIGFRGRPADGVVVRLRHDSQLPELLAESGDRFRELLERGALYVLGLDTSGNVTYANQALADRVGCSPDEMLGLDWFAEFLVDDEVDWLDESFRSYLEGQPIGTYIENAVKVPGAKPRQVRWFNMRITDPDGEVQGTLSAGADVTERQRLERRLTASANITTALLAEEGVPAVLELVATGARELVWADVAMMLTPARGSGMIVEAVSGFDPVDAVGQAVPEGPWETSIDARPSALPLELEAHLGGVLPFPSGPNLAVGLWGRSFHGVLVVAGREGEPPFDAEDMAALEGYARDAALSLEYAQASRRLHHLAIVEDRERIARDLHDIVIQDLFSAGMSIDVAMQLVGENEEVVARLTEAVETLNRSIDELRGSIFSLRDDSAEDLRTRVMRLVAEATSALGLTPVVRVENATRPLSPPVANHLLATLREALSNVARHSRAGEVEIHVVAGPEVKLIVHDDGEGLPAEIPEGRGLENMAARAEQLGGKMSITEPVDGGVRIEWTVPATETKS